MIKPNPIDNVIWMDPEDLSCNNYNPNHVFGPELQLLRESLVEDGWTQPIVVSEKLEIIDGYHRWVLTSRYTDVQDLHAGQVPVVMLKGRSASERMLSTVRHNRARGQHGILAMGVIVRHLQDDGYTVADIEKRLGMELEEQTRLSELRGSPELHGRDSFGKGWVPTRDGLSTASRSSATKKKKVKAQYGDKP